VSERDHYPAGVPCWVDTAQPDPEAALGFYGAVLGWAFVGCGSAAGDPSGSHYVAQLRGKDVAGISSALPGGALPRPEWVTYVAVESADAAAARARDAGGVIVVEPFDASPSVRIAVLRDPAGAAFGVWQAGLRSGAQLVNEPSAWAMSTLNTDNPERATAFYRALFGWTSTPSAGGATLLRLPGHVGGEPEQPVPRELVAVMRPADGIPSWTVEFLVADVDQAAATTVEHGGVVMVSPHELPRFRNAVIADPHGARLSLSQLEQPPAGTAGLAPSA
jgi:predicted enzyme related to lactoylglutathione lyase